jgi:hypothetical protein
MIKKLIFAGIILGFACGFASAQEPTGPRAPKPRPLPKPSTIPGQTVYPSKDCPTTKVCVKWGPGAPGSLAGPCTQYEYRRQCRAI